MLLIVTVVLPKVAQAAGIRHIVIPPTVTDRKIIAELWTPCGRPAPAVVVDRSGIPYGNLMFAIPVMAYRNLLPFVGDALHPDVGSGGNIMSNRSNFRSISIALVVLAGAAIAVSAIVSHAQENSAPVLLRGTDIGHFTVSATKDPQVVITSDHAVGEMTSVGGFTLTAEEHINLQTLQVSQARFTLTAGNGDRLTGTYHGTAHSVGIPNVIEYDVAGLISGGTGQFEGMSGAIVFHGSADLGQGTFKDEILGVVTLER